MVTFVVSRRLMSGCGKPRVKIARDRLRKALAGLFVGLAVQTNGPAMIDDAELYRRYVEFQEYVQWSESDRARVVSACAAVEPRFEALVADFYAEIARHREAARVIRGGEEQVMRLRGTLVKWLSELFSGVYDLDYVGRRGRVGERHVEIGLEQIYTNAALSRLRSGILQIIANAADGAISDKAATARSIDKLLDLDLAIIEMAYHMFHQEKMQRAERLITLGQVAGGVAHELRNPLNVIRTSAFYLLNAKRATDEKRTEHLERIERNIDLAESVISALASFARLPVPALHPTRVEEVVLEVLHSEPAPDLVAVRIEKPPDLPSALADRDQLRIVLANLIRNAIDAMPTGGDLLIRLESNDSKFVVSVIDTGSGIAPEHLARVMEPLYSTKTRGLGLGLSIAKAILEKCRGVIEVCSTVGAGSTFKVTLPVAPHSS